MVRQSAFSVIELCISLVLLSFGMIALHKILLESRYYFRNSGEQQCITVFIWSISNAFRFLDPALQAETIAYWRQRFKDIEPGSDLRVHTLSMHYQCLYTIQLRWGSLSEKELRFQVLSEAAV